MVTTRRIGFQDIAHLPLPGMNAPVDIKYSADGRLVTYLYSSDQTLSRELWAHDRQTGREWRLLDPPPSADQPPLTREEELRRERQRQLATGVTGYAWSETGDTLLVKAGPQVLARRGHEGEPRPVGGTGCLDPQLNRDGTMLAFVRDGELYVQDLADTDAAPRRLTFDAADADAYGDRVITNGLAEFVAQEEMHRFSGFWWSPDGARLAFEQVDNTPVPLYFISHPGTDEVQLEAHRYPFAGKANARVRLGVVPAMGDDIKWLWPRDDLDCYLARVNWTPDGLLLVQVEDREQQRLDLIRIDPNNGEAATLWAETAEPWINLHDDLRFVHRDGAPADDYAILWSSERTGRRELYLHDRDGRLLRQLTSAGPYVDEVRGVDAEQGWVYFEGWRESPLERQLFCVPLSGGAVQQLTVGPGIHRCVLAPDCRSFAEVFSSADAPPLARLRTTDGDELARIGAGHPPDARVDELDLRPPEFVRVTARDGETLYGALYRPQGLTPGAKAPVVVDVYGGPHAQQVVNGWGMTVDLRAQYLAQEGFLVFVLDNRGSARRGLAFEGRIARNLGDLEVQDQVDGVRWLASMPEADLDRVGVYGWSYGGYMAVMCLARAPEVYHAAVAGAPVTHWDGYDTHYTERYMGLPDQNADGYRQSSVMEHLQHIRGRLLIVHGMIDENVHFRHAGRLVHALIRAGIPHDVLFFPEERHGPRREEERVFLEREIARFFQENL